MRIVGKYVGIWVTREEVSAIFGFVPPSSARAFMIGGRVVGETLGLGLWMEMEFVSEGGPASNLFPDLPKEKPRRLVRWEFIRAAEMFDDVPAMERQVDFQPRAA